MAVPVRETLLVAVLPALPLRERAEQEKRERAHRSWPQARLRQVLRFEAQRPLLHSLMRADLETSYVCIWRSGQCGLPDRWPYQAPRNAFRKQGMK